MHASCGGKEKRASIMINIHVWFLQYESNETAWQLVSGCSQQLFEAQETLLLLLDSQQSVLLANRKAQGLGSTGEWTCHRMK